MVDLDNQKLRILIVDDTVKNIQVLGTILRQEEYQINVAQNGLQALEIVQKVRPDLILLDVMMPELDGFETCKRLKADAVTADIPVIFLTAKIETEDIVQGFELGAVDYVTKPFNPTELLVRVRTHLSIHLLQSALKHSLADIARMQREQEAFLKSKLQAHIGPLREQVQALAQSSPQAGSILENINGLSSLVDTMQQLQEFESGSVEVQKATVDLSQLVDNAASELTAIYGGLAEIKTENTMRNPAIGLDAGLMSGALQNLFQLAVEHVAPLPDPTVTVALSNEDDQAIVTVRYGGEPVPPDQLAMFFDKFHADMPNTEGTGLETNYAYLVTAAHGGEIAVVSDEVVGTTVTMKLPQA